jgi:uncharacterized membrane protein YbhN (UPF0104 family)
MPDRLLRFALSLALLAAVVWYAGGLGAILRPISTADPVWVVVAFTVVTLDRLLMTFKWTRLLRSQGVRLDVLPGLKIYCAAMVTGLVLPSTMGADAARVALTVRRGLDGHTVLASVIVERIVGFIASLLLGLAGYAALEAHDLLDARLEGLGRAGAAVLAAAVLFFGLSLSARCFGLALTGLPARVRGSRPVRWLQRFHTTYARFRGRRGALATFAALTVAEQIVTIVYVWCTARAVGVDVGLLFMAGVLPLTLLVSRLPISFDGLGVFEVVFVALMGLGGVPPAQAISVAVIGRIIQTLAWLPWALAQALERPRPARAPLARPAEARHGLDASS